MLEKINFISKDLATKMSSKGGFEDPLQDALLEWALDAMVSLLQLSFSLVSSRCKSSLMIIDKFSSSTSMIPTLQRSKRSKRSLTQLICSRQRSASARMSQCGCKCLHCVQFLWLSRISLSNCSFGQVVPLLFPSSGMDYRFWLPPQPREKILRRPKGSTSIIHEKPWQPNLGNAWRVDHFPCRVVRINSSHCSPGSGNALKRQHSSE